MGTLKRSGNMLKIGRYGIALGPVLWFQTGVTARVWHFLCFWFIREARPHDVDKERQFPLGTPMEYEGRVYHYWKAGENIGKGKYVGKCETVKRSR